MTIDLNGEPHEVATGATVADLLAQLSPGETRGVAVAVDGEVVPRGVWDATALHDGGRVELLRAAQGG
ncbi:MAG: sulfur carrier protein ThiS [Actinomycetes bacterium]